jgi:hypothetical protein
LRVDNVRDFDAGGNVDGQFALNRAGSREACADHSTLPSADDTTMPLSRAFIDALDTTPPDDASTNFGELPVSVWATAQTSPAAQRKGRYVPESTAHPAKILPAVAAHANEHYTKPGEVVLDPMCGIGTTLVEAIDLGRRAVGVEYEPHWVDIARANLHLAHKRGHDHDAQVVRGDARQLETLLPGEYVGQVALVVTSPPYGPSVHGQVSTGTETEDGKVRKHHYRYGSALDRGNLANIGHHRLRPHPAPRRPRGDHGPAVARARRADRLAHSGHRLRRRGRPGPGRAVRRPSRPRRRHRAGRTWQLFQRDFIRKQRDAGLPLHLIAHEDVIVFGASGWNSTTGY